jgi:RNA polymerase-binding transcription factor DksA
MSSAFGRPWSARGGPAAALALGLHHSSPVSRPSQGRLARADISPEETMTREELEQYRERLHDLAARLRNEVRSVQPEALRGVTGERSGNLSDIPHHLADLGTDYHEHEVSLGLLANEQMLLAQTATALERLDQGTFGRCVECGREIPAGRLQALPYTSHCVECANRAEREQL